MNLEVIEKRLKKIESLLVGIKAIFTINDLAEYTNLSKSYIYKLTSTNKIPHFKPNGKICYFNKLEIDNWIQQNKVKDNNELEQKAINYSLLKAHKK